MELNFSDRKTIKFVPTPVGIDKVISAADSTTEIYLHSIGHPDRQAIAVYELARQKSHTESHTEKKGHRDNSVTL
jgi:hypothetical protein